jgi:hypothetical protein
MRSLWLWLALQNAPVGPAAPAVPAADPAGKAPVKDEKAIEPAPKPTADAVIAHAIDTLDSNKVVAIVNGDVVTVRDVWVTWKLLGRTANDPERKAFPGDEEVKQIKKQIVELRLWRMHARLFPAIADFMTPDKIDELARENYASLLQLTTLTEDEKALIRERTEEEISRYIVLDNDPEYKRVKLARPEDVQRWWDDPYHKDAHRVPTTATLGRVMLGRELYGDKVETLAKDLRQRAQELGSLEKAAQELAPGSYSEHPTLKNVPLDGPNVSLRDEVLEFARSAQPGDLSAPIGGQVSVMLFVLIERKDGKERTFEEAAPIIKENLEHARMAIRAEEYFVTKILSEALFLPEDLFDDEIDRFVPGNSARRKAEAARRKAQAANPAK